MKQITRSEREILVEVNIMFPRASLYWILEITFNIYYYQFVARLPIWSARATTWPSRTIRSCSFTRPPAWITNLSGSCTTSSFWPPRTTFAQWLTSSQSGWSRRRRSTTTWTTFRSARPSDNWNKSSLELIHDNTKKDSRRFEQFVFKAKYLAMFSLIWHFFLSCSVRFPHICFMTCLNYVLIFFFSVKICLKMFWMTNKYSRSTFFFLPMCAYYFANS